MQKKEGIRGLCGYDVTDEQDAWEEIQALIEKDWRVFFYSFGIALITRLLFTICSIRSVARRSNLAPTAKVLFPKRRCGHFQNGNQVSDQICAHFPDAGGMGVLFF